METYTLACPQQCFISWCVDLLSFLCIVSLTLLEYFVLFPIVVFVTAIVIGSTLHVL